MTASPTPTSYVCTRNLYRHMFAKLKTSLDDKLNAWNNYCELFEFVLASEDASLELTAQWVFDVLHELCTRTELLPISLPDAGRNSEE